MKTKISKRRPDFRVENCGSMLLLWASSPDGECWERENLDTARTILPGGLTAIEPRYFDDLALAILADGLTIQDAVTGQYAVIGGGNA